MLTWDLMRLIDWLRRDGRFDTEALGCLGFSGGGMQTLWLAALDERVKLAVISGYLYGYRDALLTLNNNCSCNYVPHPWEHLGMGDIASPFGDFYRGIFMNKTDLRNAILSGIEAPRIGSNQVRVLPDLGRLQTRQLQAAIDALSAEGGGRLTLPAGIYRTGALHLKSGVELHLASPETLVQFTAESPEDNYPLVFSYWEASPCYNYSALLYACDAEDIAVTGYGILDGGADQETWWNWHHQVETSWSEDKPDLQLEDRKALRRMNQEGIPVEQRIFGPGHWLRPNFFQTIRCRRVLLQDVTLRNSPMWQLNPVQCQSVIVDGVTLSSHGANNDGCDPESCSGVWIKNCRFDTGDDCISLKSGRGRDGREANIPCENILIEHNESADGHGGVDLGSEMSGGIRKVLACDNRFSSPNLTYALRLKTNAKRGGKVEQIMLCDSVMDHVHGAAVHGTMPYEDGRNGDQHGAAAGIMAVSEQLRRN